MASMDASSSGSMVNACASLSLDEEEDEGLVIAIDEVNEDSVEYKYVLVGKLLTEKPVKFKILRDTIAAIWRPSRGMMVKEAGYNLFVFQFFHEVDINRVMEDGPWCFDQSLLVLHRVQPSESPFDVPLCKAEFWVQVHKLPIGFFTENIAKAIGDYLGTFIRADRSNFDGSWKAFLRVRTLLDITKPLRRRMKVKKEGGDWFWAEFKYERLPHFCFLCGLMGHTERYCERMYEGVTPETVRPYGSWLKATGRRFPVTHGSRWLVEEPPLTEEIQTPEPQQSSTGKRESSSDDSSSEEESSDEEEDAPSKTPKKQKTPVTHMAESQGSKSLFMGNLSWSIEQADVENFFKDCGEIKDVRFASHPDGTFKGYGHVEFTTSEAAAKALELNGQQLLGREVKLDFAKERGAYTLNSGKFDNSFQRQGRGGGESTTVFVKAFDKNDIEDKIRSALEDHFGSCGEIKDIRLPMDPEGYLKGMAYIEFTDSDAMNKALELNNSQIGNNTLYVDEAKPRGDSRGGGENGGRGGWGGGGRGGGRRGGGGGGGGGRGDG